MSTTTLDARVDRHSQELRDVRADYSKLEQDYYGKGNQLGIRGRVLVLWYGAASLVSLLGAAGGYFLRMLVEN